MVRNNDFSLSQNMGIIDGPKVSVIVPAFNQGEFLAEALDSVLNQTYSNWECVIVNDGSTDDTEEVAMRYMNKDCRFRYLFQKNAGVSAARNNAIASSDGVFILPLDSDNILCPTYLEKAVAVFLACPVTTLVYGKAEKFGDETGVWDLPEYSYDRMIWLNCIDNCAMFKRSDFEATSGYQDTMLEDWGLWLSLLKPDSVVYCYDEVLFRYRVRNDGRHVEDDRKIEIAAEHIYQNHKEVYAPYLSKIVYLGQERLVYKDAYTHAQSMYDAVLASKAYRLGKFLLKPLSWLRDR